MNRFFVFFLFFSSSLFSISDFYKELRIHFKDQMCFAQRGLMKEAEYNVFVETYLQELEKTSKIIQYFMESQQKLLYEYYSGPCYQYMTRLLLYNIFCFHNTVKSNSANKKALASAAEDLINLIETIKADCDLKDLGVQLEFKKTSDIIHQANKDYYNKINFGTKVYFWVGYNMVIPIVRSFV